MTSRAEALTRLQAFMPQVLRYASARNYVRPGYEEVSRLSHWIRYRAISEEECVTTVLDYHSPKTAEKFLQEILWRTYWKGWLELHPMVWAEYLAESATLLQAHGRNEEYCRAISGDTSLSFFNEWVSELIQTGYLHNHTRMWFASVWIFTLKLPWQLGACFMFHNLLDADPASNTLSWRWVAGLQTPGKIYVARPDNISTYSDGRWSPKHSELATNPVPLYPLATPALHELNPVSDNAPPAGSLILLHDDDLSADLSPEMQCPGAQFCLFAPPLRESSAGKAAFISALRQDATLRREAKPAASAKEISELAREIGTSEIHAMTPRVGFEQEYISALEERLTEVGISVVWHRRAWDSRLMPLARGGFFKFWEQARELL